MKTDLNKALQWLSFTFLKTTSPKKCIDDCTCKCNILSLLLCLCFIQSLRLSHSSLLHGAHLKITLYIVLNVFNIDPDATIPKNMTHSWSLFPFLPFVGLFHGTFSHSSPLFTLFHLYTDPPYYYCLSSFNNRSTTAAAAAAHWKVNIYFTWVSAMWLSLLHTVRRSTQFVCWSFIACSFCAHNTLLNGSIACVLNSLRLECSRKWMGMKKKPKKKEWKKHVGVGAD